MVDAPFAAALEHLMSTREDVVVVSADLSKWTDVLGFSTRHADRFVQVGMAEQNLIGVTAGLAKSGWLPIAVTFGVFASRRAYDQVAMSLATRPCHAIIAGFLPGIESRFRGTHQAIDDVSLLASLPGLTVIDPADATELEQAVVAAAGHPGVVYIRCSRGKVERLFDPETHTFAIGKAVRLQEGSGRVGVVTTGAATRWTQDALRLLPLDSQDGISVMHVATLKPFPRTDVQHFCAQHASIVSVENHLTHGGLGSLVATAITDVGIGRRLHRLGVSDRWGAYGSPRHSRHALGLDDEALASALSLALRNGTATS